MRCAKRRSDAHFRAQPGVKRGFNRVAVPELLRGHGPQRGFDELVGTRPTIL